MRWCLVLAAVLGMVGCSGSGQATVTPRTALEQRLAQGAAPRAPSPTASPTPEPVTPEATWTPVPFGRRATPTVVAPLNARQAQVARLESDSDIAVRIDGRDQPISFVGVRPLGRAHVSQPVDCF